MGLHLYDTASRQVRPLTPRVAGTVGIYACGPTVQAAPHVGHLRSAVVVDVLHRWLLESGLRVVFVRNVTDVDDKIIHDAAHNDEPWWALATRSERAFVQAYDAVQVLPPVATPRVTASLPSIVALIERIISRGHAYASEGDVYLSVRSVPTYGALSGQDPDALRASEKQVPHGHTGSKRDPLDFALWKAAKPGEPSWPSPWGPGRPGWHIECSAMAVDHLGPEFDLHAGGLDLVFPHHENELAQSTCAGHPFARHWLHHGLVTTGGEKMSKSTGVATGVEEVLATTRPQVLRYALGAGHYRSALEWSTQTLPDAEAAYGRLETFVRNATDLVGAERVVDGSADGGPAAGWAEFAAALDDDLGVPQSLAVLHATVRTGNAQMAAGDVAALGGTLSSVRRMLRVLALDPVSQWPAAGSGDLAPVVDALVQLAVEARAQARARKDWAQADAVRDRLAAAGIVLEDTAQGVRWRLAPRETAPAAV